MLPEEAKAIAEHQRCRFNELVDIFDRPQPSEVMVRLWEIVASAELRLGAVVLDVGTGAGVLILSIQSYQPSKVLACDVAEKRTPKELSGSSHLSRRFLRGRLGDVEKATTVIDKRRSQHTAIMYLDRNAIYNNLNLYFWD